MTKACMATVSRVLEDAVHRGDVPGVAAAVATRDGPVFAAGFGTRDLRTGAPMTADSVVWIASMTKAVTAACVMQLVEQGLLQLDAPISEILPELGRVQVLQSEGMQGGTGLRAPRTTMTLRHLLTHTSGYGYNIWNADLSRYMEAHGLPGIITCRHAATALPLLFDPGERWEYGIGIDWVGKVVEAVSGMKLGRYMHEHLFAPLGMADTGFEIGAAQRSRLAKVHARDGENLVATDMEIPQQPEMELGGAGLYSTVGDYLIFAQMIMHDGLFNGARILAAETVARMSENAMGALDVRPMTTAMPALSNDVGFIAGMKWGLSFMINPEPLPTGRSAGSLAWAGLANSFYWIDRRKQVAGVYATQILPFLDAKAASLFDRFETEVYDAL